MTSHTRCVASEQIFNQSRKAYGGPKPVILDVNRNFSCRTIWSYQRWACFLHFSILFLSTIPISLRAFLFSTMRQHDDDHSNFSAPSLQLIEMTHCWIVIMRKLLPSCSLLYRIYRTAIIENWKWKFAFVIRIVFKLMSAYFQCQHFFNVSTFFDFLPI